MSIEQRYQAVKAQSLLKEHGDYLKQLMDEVVREYSGEINEESIEAIAIGYSRQQGARRAMHLLLTKINSKANERKT